MHSILFIPSEEAHAVVPFQDGEVTELYVAPEARSRGIGAALIHGLERWFREHGCGAVHIAVFAPNEAARRFCERLHYQARDNHQIKLLEPAHRAGTPSEDA